MFFITSLLYYSTQKGNIRKKITILEHTFRKKSYTMPYSVKPVNFRKNNHRTFFVQNLIFYKKGVMIIFPKNNLQLSYRPFLVKNLQTVPEFENYHF